MQPGEFKVYGNNQVVLAVKDIENDDDFTLYPNPAIGEFKINKQVKQIEIYDLIGRKVKSFVGNFNGQHSFDVSTLKPSIYLVKINSDFGTSSKRLIIE